MSNWKSIETAPKDGTWILGWLGHRNTGEAKTLRWTDGAYYQGFIDKNGATSRPTHWMPLPEPPDDAAHPNQR